MRRIFRISLAIGICLMMLPVFGLGLERNENDLISNQIGESPSIAEALTSPSSTATKFFNLTFIEDWNFTEGQGSWIASSGAWVYNAGLGEIYSEYSAGAEILYDPANLMKDSTVTLDYRNGKNPAVSDSAVMAVLSRYNPSSGNYFEYSIPSHNVTGQWAEVLKRWGNVPQSNWAHPTTYWPLTWPKIVGNNAVLLSYNNTWMRVVVSQVQYQIFGTWHNLTDNNTNTYRMDCQDYDSSIGTQAIRDGFVGVRTWKGNLSIRQVLYDYPFFPISIRAGQSISVHLTTNYSTPTISGSPSKGAFSNGYWNYTSNLSDIGAYNVSFSMTSAMANVTKQIKLSVFPDLTGNGYWYASNPVFPNQVGNMSNQLYDPTLLKDTDGYYKIWFSVNQPAPYAGFYTYHFRSLDGFNWETGNWTNPLTTIPVYYEKTGVVKVGSIYYMVVGKSDRSGIYAYQSSDGISWSAMNGGSAIITPTYAWEEETIQAPHVFYHNGTFHVTYAICGMIGIGVGEPRGFGLASGASLTTLTKHPNALMVYQQDANGNLSTSFGSVKPYRYGNVWLAIINGADPNNQFHATVAMSDDLISWIYYPDFSAFPLGSQSWETVHAYTGNLLEDDNGALSFWFNGHNGAKEQIGEFAYIPPNLGFVFNSPTTISSQGIQHTATAWGKAVLPNFHASLAAGSSSSVNLTVNTWASTYFAWTATGSTATTEVTFTVTGLNSHYDYQWRVDGNPLYSNKPVAGSLSYTYPGGSGSHVFSLAMIQSQPGSSQITADFSYKIDGSTVQFMDESDGTGIYRWIWDFGDGQISNEQDPTHVYAAPGKYTVILGIEDSLGDTDTITKSIQIGESPSGFLGFDFGIALVFGLALMVAGILIIVAVRRVSAAIVGAGALLLGIAIILSGLGGVSAAILGIFVLLWN